MVDRTELPPPLQQIDRTYVLWRGRKLSYFGGCDYFRLSSHPQILKAIRDGLDRFGLNVAASRFTTGNHVLYGQLEAELCRFFRTETATLLSNGYAANIVAAQALAGEFSHAFIDSRAHQSLRDCLPFLQCEVSEFPHRDVAGLTAKVKRRGGKARILVLTDGLFSHNGSLAPLARYLEILPTGSRILLDDAHGAGTIGPTGRGTVEALGIESPFIIQTISLSKAFGVYGGAILGPKSLRKKLLRRSPLIKGNTPLPLPLAYAAIRAVALLRGEKSLRQRLQEKAAYVHSAAGDGGTGGPESLIPIIALCPSTPQRARILRERLLAEEIFPTEIRYHTNQTYFRFAISSEHARGQFEALIRACRREFAALAATRIKPAASRLLRPGKRL